MPDLETSIEVQTAPEYVPVAEAFPQLFVTPSGIVGGATLSNILAPGHVKVSREAYDLAFGRIGRCTYDGTTVTQLPDPEPEPAPVPDNPTLGDWRVALLLWTRPDANGSPSNRLTDVMNRVFQLDANGVAIAAVAKERLEYSNNVKRSELMQLKDAFGFTAEEVDESLYRAQQVSLGDLSGVWPLPT